MKKSAHQILKEAKEQNLTKDEFKEKLKSEGVIVSKESINRQHEIAENIQKRIKTNTCKHENITREDGLDECLDCGVRNY